MKTYKKLKIGHVAGMLGVQKSVLRFWEKEFELSARRSEGGQRCYNQKDIEQFKRIKELLYEQGFTIAGAKKLLEKPEEESTRIKGSQKTTMPQEESANNVLSEQLMALQKQLLKLKELL